MENQSASIKTISLSLEELSLALGLLDFKEMANVLIRSVYPDLTDKAMNSRLISATHSLLARGYAILSDEKTPQLVDEFKSVIQPFGQYDQLIQVIQLTKNLQVRTTISVQDGRNFTSQTSDRGIIRKLDYGPTSLLPNYIQDLFPGFGKDPCLKDLGRVPDTVLSESSQAGKTETTSPDLLLQNGWQKKLATEFLEDLQHNKLKAILVKKKVSSRLTAEEMLKTPHHSLLILQGKRHWVIDFPEKEQKLGIAQTVNRETFGEKISQFLEE